MLEVLLLKKIYVKLIFIQVWERLSFVGVRLDVYVHINQCFYAIDLFWWVPIQVTDLLKNFGTFFHCFSVFSSLKWRYNSNRGAFEVDETCRYKLLLGNNMMHYEFFYFYKSCRSSIKCLSFCLLRCKNTPGKDFCFFLSHVIKLPGYCFVCKK